MATARRERIAVAAGHPGMAWARAALLAALLSLAPLLAGVARAQRVAAIQATATVITSKLDAGLQRDTARAVAPLAPATARLRVAGLGVVRVQTGPSDAIRVRRVAPDPRSRASVVVEIASVGS